MEKKLLQTAVVIGGLVPLVAGIDGMIFGSTMTGAFQVHDVSLDSHVRYLSGLLFAIGLAFWSCVPHIEVRSERFRLLTLIVVVGGFARLFGMMIHGLPSAPMVFGLFMELGVVPLLCLWQFRLTTKHT